MNNKTFFLKMLPAVVAVTSSFCACESVDLTAESENSQEFTIEASMVNNPWVEASASKGITRADGSLEYNYYIFNSTGGLVKRISFTMPSSGASANYRKRLALYGAKGTYTVFGILNTYYNDIPKDPPVTLDSEFELTEAIDISMGSKDVVVLDKAYEYEAIISTHHIMSKLQLTINNVPEDIISINVILPNQASKYNFRGEFYGDDTSQKLQLVRSLAPNTSDANGLVAGTYNWTLPETITFPCATGTSEMLLDIEAEGLLTNYTFSTQTSSCLTSGKRINLTTTWSKLDKFVIPDIIVEPWGDVENGSFDMGGATATNK